MKPKYNDRGDLNVTGESTLSSLSVTGNETVSGTLSVTEATTLSSLSVNWKCSSRNN